MSTVGAAIQDLTTLFIDYRPGFVNLLNDRVLARKLAVGKDYKWEGDYVLKKLQISRHTGLTMGEDGMALPPAGIPTMIDSKAYRRFFAAKVQVTDGALNTATSDKNAAKSTAKLLLSDIATAAQKFQNFMLTRDGTGAVANVHDFSGTTLTVDDARGLWRNQWYTVRNASNAIQGTFQVTRVTLSPTAGRATVTVSGMPSSYTKAAGDYVTWGKDYWEVYNTAYTGLDALIANTGTLQGISTTNYPEWQSLVYTTSSGTQSQSTRLFREMLAGIFQLGGAEKVSLFNLTSVWDMIQFEELWEGEVRITPQAKVAGIVAPMFHSQFGNVMPYTDADAPYGTMFFVDLREITRAVQKDLDWRKNEGGGILTKSDTHQVWHGDMSECAEFMIDNRRRCGKIENLTNSIKVMH